jgi:methionyl-tRNA formyltransferase
MPLQARAKVVVLTSSPLGLKAARALLSAPGVELAALIVAPRYSGGGLAGKVRRMLRHDGALRLARAVVARAAGRRQRTGPAWWQARVAELSPTPSLVYLDSFSTVDAVARVSELAADLGVIVATPILSREIYAAPRLGSVNLHFGKAPEYRGSTPGFWELYHGEREVGVTIHQVTDRVDAGDIFAQRTLPLEPAPEADPLAYLTRFRAEVLFPAGIRLLAETVPRILAGEVDATPQSPGAGSVFRRATYRDEKELRRRVARRRTGRS